MGTLGGKRVGAGRKREHTSYRAVAEKTHVSVYKIRQSEIIFELAKRLGIADMREMIEGGLTLPCQARRLCRIAAFDAQHGTNILQMTRDDAKTMGWAKAIRPMWRRPSRSVSVDTEPD
jgi:hypothetical protein